MCFMCFPNHLLKNKFVGWDNAAIGQTFVVFAVLHGILEAVYP